MSYYVVQTLLLLVLAYFLGAWIGCTFRSWFSYRRFERAYWKNPEAYAAAGTGSTIEDQVLEFVDTAEIVPEAEIEDQAPEPVRRSVIAETQEKHRQERSLEQVAQSVVDREPQDLRRIKGIEMSDIVLLDKHNVRSFDQIVHWTADDVRQFNKMLGNEEPRIQQQNWIEQAAVLSRGQKTQFAEQFDAQTNYVVSEPAEQTARPLADEIPDETSNQAVEGSLLEQPSEVVVEEAIQDASDEELQPSEEAQDSEVVDEVNELLDTEPVQSQELDHSETQIFDEPVAEEITEEEIIEDAQHIPDQEDLRDQQEFLDQADGSVHQDTTEQADVSDPAKEHTLPPDNLKRIGGIGVIIERRLNALGIYRYDQIAAWTDADVERVDTELDFPGRIEREEWREQAQILAEGGTTDFASRFDRGDVGPEDE